MGLRLGIWPAVRSILRSGTIRRLNHGTAAPALEEKHLANCRVVTDRFHMLELLPKQGVAAEVGVLYGDFSEEILRRTEPRELHLPDIRRRGSERI